VVVKREKVTDRRKETFFGKIERDSVVRELGYRIVAENLRDKPVSLRIVDSLPVSRIDRIKVEDLTLTPPPDEKTSRIARASWPGNYPSHRESRKPSMRASLLFIPKMPCRWGSSLSTGSRIRVILP
jgi:hypothetical protein